MIIYGLHPIDLNPSNAFRFTVNIRLPYDVPPQLLKILRDVIFHYTKVVSDTYLDELLGIAEPFIYAANLKILPERFPIQGKMVDFRDTNYHLSINYIG